MRALKSILIAATILSPVAAHAACVQSDLTGVWRIDFNTGRAIAGDFTQMMTCMINIRANGLFNITSCKPVTGASDAGSATVQPERPFRVTSNCDVILADQGTGIAVTLDFGVTGQGIDAFRMTLNRGKDVMIGYGSVSGGVGMVAVTAVKRD